MTWARICSRERRLFFNGLSRARPVISLICASTSSAAAAKSAALGWPVGFPAVARAVVCCAKAKDPKLAPMPIRMIMKTGTLRGGAAQGVRQRVQVRAQIILLSHQRCLQNSVEKLLMTLLKGLPSRFLRINGAKAGMFIHIRRKVAQGSQIGETRKETGDS